MQKLRIAAARVNNEEKTVILLSLYVAQMSAHQKQAELDSQRKVKLARMEADHLARAKAAEDRHDALLEDMRKKRVRGEQRVWGPCIVLATMVGRQASSYSSCEASGCRRKHCCRRWPKLVNGGTVR